MTITEYFPCKCFELESSVLKYKSINAVIRTIYLIGNVEYEHNVVSFEFVSYTYKCYFPSTFPHVHYISIFLPCSRSILRVTLQKLFFARVDVADLIGQVELTSDESNVSFQLIIRFHSTPKKKRIEFFTEREIIQLKKCAFETRPADQSTSIFAVQVKNVSLRSAMTPSATNPRQRRTTTTTSKASPADPEPQLTARTMRSPKYADGSFWSRVKGCLVVLAIFLFIQVVLLILLVSFKPDVAFKVYEVGVETASVLLPAGSINNATVLTEFGLNASCGSIAKDAQSAVKRAKTRECKELIAEIACKHERGELYPERLQSLCPVHLDARVAGNELGCYKDSFSERLLNGASIKQKEDNTHESCLKICSESGFLYAGVQYSNECFCGNVKPDVATRRLQV